jgi:hypothetical protein
MAKTPIVMLNKVKNALNFWLRIESKDWRIVSNIFSIFYSYRIAITGSKFDARIAGTNPANTPTITEITEAIPNKSNGIVGDRNCTSLTY